MSTRATRAIAPIIIGVVGVAILLMLGTWQVQRLAWKEGLIAEIEARMAADPVPVPGAPDPERDAYLRVGVDGRLGTDELHVLTSVRPLGPGYRVVVPFWPAGEDQEAEAPILVDLGFVPEAQKDRDQRFAPGGAVNVTGLLYWPNERDSFTPDPDLGRNIWFARDVTAMAEALDTRPVLLVAASHSAGDWPRPQPPGVDLPNRHREYAFTWFGMAAVWALMAIFWLRSVLRERRTA